MTVNLKSPEGKEIIKAMVKEVDVVVENFRGTMKKLGLDYEVLKSTRVSFTPLRPAMVKADLQPAPGL